MSSTSASTPSRFGDRALVVLEAIVGVAVVAAIVGKAYGPAPTVVFVMTGSAVAFTTYVIVRMAAALRDRTLDVTGRTEDEARDALEHEKLLLLQGIKELEADFAIGKVAPEDYEHLRKTAEHRAIGIIDRLKQSDEKWLGEARRLVEKRVGRAAATGHVATDEPTSGRTIAADDTPTWAAEDRATRERRLAIDLLFDDRPVKMTAMTAASGAATCNACETENDVDAKYCVGCGRPKVVAA